MRKEIESHVKYEVKKQLKALGAYQFWPVQQGLGAATLDCLASLDGLFVAIETKAPGKKPTPRQEMTINAIEKSGAKTLVIDCVAMAKRLPELLYNVGFNITCQ